MDRDSFVLLDAYLRDCLEEWSAFGRQLSARSVILLDDCARSITRRWKHLDGEGQYYFGQFRRLAWQILRGVDMEQAYCQAEDESLDDPTTCVEMPECRQEVGNIQTHWRFRHSFRLTR